MDPVLIPRQLFLTVFLLFIWIALFLTKRHGELSSSLSRLSLLLLLCQGLLALLAVVSVLYANTISESLYVASKSGIVFLFFLTTCLLLSARIISSEDLKKGVLIFFVVSLGYGVFDISMILANDRNLLEHSQRITATSANKNLFASALLLCLWAVLDIRRNNLIRLLLLLLSAMILLVVQSKIVTAAVAFILLVLFTKNLATYFRKNKVATILGIVSLLIAATAILFNLSRFENLSSLHSFDTRLQVWKNSLLMSREFPWGVGAGNWQIFFPKYGLSGFDLDGIKNGLITFQRPHNDFIWVLCELGYVGLMLYVSFFCIVLIMQVRLIRLGDHPFALTLLLIVLGYCGVAFFDFPLERIEHQVLLAVLVSVANDLYRDVPVTRREVRPNKFTGLALILISFSLIVCGFRLKGELLTRQFILLDKAKHAEFVIYSCDEARSLFYSIDAASTPLDWYAGISFFSQQKYKEADARFREGLRLTPFNHRLLMGLAIVNEKLGNRLEAERYRSMAAQISPTDKMLILK
jgi:O-antigen ligase